MLDFKKVTVLSDTLTVEKFVIGTVINRTNCYENHNPGNLFNEYSIKILSQINSVTKVFFNVTFISSKGLSYTYDYYFMIKAKWNPSVT